MDKLQEPTQPELELSATTATRGQGWGLDLCLIGALILIMGVGLGSTAGVWSPWEALVARALEHMSATQSWLTLWLPAEDGLAMRPSSQLPFGWWLNALCYQLWPLDVSLRAPQLISLTLGGCAVYSAARAIASERSLVSASEDEARREALLVTTLWLATPAVLLGTGFSLGGLGVQLTSLATLWWLTPLARRAWGAWAGVALWLSAALSLGFIGLVSPLITLVGRGGERGAQRGDEPRHPKLLMPLLIATAALAFALWRLSVKSAFITEGGSGAWLELLALHMSSFGGFNAESYQGFHLSVRSLAHGLFPIGVLAPAAFAEALSERDSYQERWVAGRLGAWLALSFLTVALNSAWASGSGELTPLMAAPVALCVGPHLIRMLKRPSLILVLTSALFLLLLVSDVKREPSLLLAPLVGQEVEGLGHQFRAWRGLVFVAYLGLGLMLTVMSPARLILEARLSSLSARSGQLARRLLDVNTSGALLSAWGLMSLAAMLYFAHGLSAHLSQRGLLNSYQALARPDEPLLRFGLSDLEAARSHYLRRLEAAPTDALKRSATSTERSFFIIKRAELSTLNKRFRRLSERHLTILDDSSHELLLASNLLREGERDLNPIGRAVIPELPETAQRFKEPFRFEDKAELIAWSMSPGALKVGGEARLTLYWRGLKKMRRSWKVFVHIDSSGQRIHADHDPVEGLYPTRDWRPGDLIQDVYPFKVKSSHSAAIHKVYVGLYSGKKRLDIKSPRDSKRVTKDQRALLGRVRVY